jgi:hypothetical protein
MKKVVYLFSVCAAMMAFAGCSNDEVVAPVKGETATLTIRLHGTAPTRATGTALPTAEDSIRNVTIGVFNGTTRLDVKKFVLTSAGEAADIQMQVPGASAVTSATVVAVANSETDLTNATAIPDLTAFNLATVGLDQTLLNASGLSNTYQVPGNLPMSGQDTGVDLTAAGGSTADISLSRLVNRISLESIGFDPTDATKSSSLVITDVYLYQAAPTAKVNPDLTIAYPSYDNTTGFLGGEVSTVGTSVAAATSWLKHTLSGTEGWTFSSTAGEGVTAKSTPKYWFYSYPNSSADNHTKLVIKAKYTGVTEAVPAGVTDQVCYYNVNINEAATWSTITPDDAGGVGIGDGNVYRNTVYKVNVTVTGIGAPNPDVDVETPNLLVDLSIANWALNITQNVEFGN